MPAPFLILNAMSALSMDINVEGSWRTVKLIGAGSGKSSAVMDKNRLDG